MSNPDVLKSRLKVLQDDVDALLETLNSLTGDVQVFGGPRVQSHVDLKNKAVGQRTTISDLIEKIAPASSVADWVKYNELRDNVAQINQEVLEIVQGLAIHRGSTDEKACWIVRRFLEGISGEPLGLTVFTARDLNVPTLGRLTRVRFPVKSIWTLPCTAHQFANLKIKDTPSLTALAKATAAHEAQSLPPPPSRFAQQRMETRIQSRWLEIMSDVLAVYFTGPSYAGSTILMRLSPAGGDVDESQASDLDRAFVILETLRQLDSKSDGEDPYKDFVAWLESRWNDMLAAAGSEGLSDARRKELLDFVSGLLTEADQSVSYAKYPLHKIPFMDSTGSWDIAQQWSKDWQTDLKNDDTLRAPGDVDASSNIRDAFNAGWLCWSKTNDVRKVGVIARAVFDLCGQIVEPFFHPVTQGPETSGRPGTRGREYAG